MRFLPFRPVRDSETAPNSPRADEVVVMASDIVCVCARVLLGYCPVRRKHSILLKYLAAAYR